MKLKAIIAIVGILMYFIISISIIILGVNIINDLKMTVNGYKSDRDICYKDHKQLIHDYYELGEECRK